MNQLVKQMRLKWMMICLTALALLAGVGVSVGLEFTQQAVAQDELPAEGPAGEEQPAAEDGDQAPAAEDDGGGNDEGNTSTEGNKSMLSWVYKALGPGYSIIFLLLSFTLVALFVMNVITSNRSKVCPVELVDDFEEMLNNKQYQDAYEMAKEHESVLGAVLSAGLAKLSSGYEQALEAMQEIGEEENMKLEHRLSYMALIGTLSPMLGLFGTVHGMIDSFETIANAGGTPEATKLAEGISTALFTTLIGLAIAIPAIGAYNIMKNHVARLMLEVGILSESLMSRFQGVGQKK